MKWGGDEKIWNCLNVLFYIPSELGLMSMYGISNIWNWTVSLICRVEKTPSQLLLHFPSIQAKGDSNFILGDNALKVDQKASAS